MKVKQLISALKKMPQNLEVFWADHDQGEYETNNIAHSVYHIQKPDEEYERDDLKEWEYQRRDCSINMDEEYVVIRP